METPLTAIDIIKSFIHLPSERLYEVLVIINNNLVKQKEEPIQVAKDIITTKPREVAKLSTGDLPPCSQCGSVVFLKTGTCHVCQVCGSSQGCS